METNPKRKTLDFGYSKVPIAEPKKIKEKLNFSSIVTSDETQEIKERIPSQQEIEANFIKEFILCIKKKKQNRELPTTKVMFINEAMTWVGILAGILMFVKGLFTGGLSIFGLFFQVFYFSVLTYSAIADKRGDWWSRFVPAISGLLLCLSQIYGIFVVNGPFECEPLKKGGDINCL